MRYPAVMTGRHPGNGKSFWLGWYWKVLNIIQKNKVLFLQLRCKRCQDFRPKQANAWIYLFLPRWNLEKATWFLKHRAGIACLCPSSAWLRLCFLIFKVTVPGLHFPGNPSKIIWHFSTRNSALVPKMYNILLDIAWPVEEGDRVASREWEGPDHPTQFTLQRGCYYTGEIHYSCLPICC